MNTRLSWQPTVFFLVVFCVSLSFSREALARGAFSGTDAVFTTNCTVQSATGSYLLAQSTYNVQGYCQVYQKQQDPKGGSTFPVQIDYLFWKAIGTYEATKYGTTEKVNIYRNDPNSIIATYTAGMTCIKDPWREAGLTCASITFQKLGSLGNYDSDFTQDFYATNTTVPMSSRVTDQQRATLNQEYQKHLLATLNSKNKPAFTPDKLPGDVSTTPSNSVNATAALQARAPVITLPTANSGNVEGRFQVKATVTGSYTGTEGVYVQFTYLGNAAAPNQNSFVNIFNISLKDLVNGITVPNYITRGQQGRWLVRAEIVSPNAGPWSPAVPFIVSQVSSTHVTPSLNKK